MVRDGGGVRCPPRLVSRWPPYAAATLLGQLPLLTRRTGNGDFCAQEPGTVSHRPETSDNAEAKPARRNEQERVDDAAGATGRDERRRRDQPGSL